MVLLSLVHLMIGGVGELLGREGVVTLVVQYNKSPVALFSGEFAAWPIGEKHFQRAAI